MINLKITKLEKSFNQPLLDNITLNHTGNGVVALIGDNGSGKSTLLKILMGLEEQDSGKIEWQGEPRIGYLEQEIDSLPTLSGGRICMMFYFWTSRITISTSKTNSGWRAPSSLSMA